MAEKMGRVFCSIEEAASRLGRSKRSIHNYIRDGLVRTRAEGGKTVLYREDVEGMALKLETDLPALTRKSFLELLLRVERLEQGMALVKRILEVRDEPLHPEAGEAVSLWRAASAALGHKGRWQLAEVELWARLFDRFDENTLTLFAKACPHPKPWRVFYDLCLAMMEHAGATATRTQAVEWLALHRQLDEGRKKMRGTVLMWVELGRCEVPEGLLGELDTPREDLARRLGGKS